MLSLTYYQTILKSGNKRGMKEDFGYLLKEIQKDQKRLKVLTYKISELQRKYSNGEKVTKKDLHRIFRINKLLQELIIVEE